MLKEGLHQQKSTANGGTVTTTYHDGGGTSTTMVLLRRTPRSSTVIGLLVNDGTAGNKTDYVVTGSDSSRDWQRAEMLEVQHAADEEAAAYLCRT